MVPGRFINFVNCTKLLGYKAFSWLSTFNAKNIFLFFILKIKPDLKVSVED